MHTREKERENKVKKKKEIIFKNLKLKRGFVQERARCIASPQALVVRSEPQAGAACPSVPVPATARFVPCAARPDVLQASTHRLISRANIASEMRQT